MSHTYAVTEIAGSSTESIDDAIRSGIATAGATLRNLEWFEVTELRGHIKDGKLGHFQVVMKLGFRYES